MVRRVASGTTMITLTRGDVVKRVTYINFNLCPSLGPGATRFSATLIDQVIQDGLSICRDPRRRLVLLD